MRSINDIDFLEKQEILDSKPVVLIGSGISLFHPTSLMSGIGFCEKLYAYIFFEDEFKEAKWLEEEIVNIPFEAFMECFPHKEKLPQLISKMFLKEAYNVFHELFAQNLLNGNFQSIITPNYDLAFDRALADLGHTKSIVGREDVQKFNRNLGGVYFKIHGTADKENTLIYTLTQEGALDG